VQAAEEKNRENELPTGSDLPCRMLESLGVLKGKRGQPAYGLRTQEGELEIRTKGVESDREKPLKGAEDFLRSIFL